MCDMYVCIYVHISGQVINIFHKIWLIHVHIKWMHVRNCHDTKFDGKIIKLKVHTCLIHFINRNLLFSEQLWGWPVQMVQGIFLLCQIIFGKCQNKFYLALTCVRTLSNPYFITHALTHYAFLRRVLID